MRFQKIIFFLFIFPVIYSVYGQSREDYCEQWSSETVKISNLDLRRAYNKKMLTKVDSLCKIDIYTHLGSICMQKRQIDSSLYFYNQAIQLAEHLKADGVRLSAPYTSKAYILINKNRENEALSILSKVRKLLKNTPGRNEWKDYYASYSLIAEKNNEYYKSIEYIDSSIALSKQTNDTVNISTKYNEKASLYFILGNYEESTKNLLYSIDLREKQENPKNLEVNYYNLGYFYEIWKKYETAIKYLRKSISRAEEVGKFHVAFSAKVLVARCYRKMKQDDNAIKIIDSVLMASKRPEYNHNIAEALREKGWIYLENLKRYSEAEDYFMQSYQIIKPLNLDGDLYANYRGLTKVFIKKNEYEKAKKYLKLFEEVTYRMNSKIRTENFLKMEVEYYEKTGQSELALKSFKKYHTIKDSISNQQVKTKVADLEKKYDTKKKELTIVNLNQEKEEQQQIAKQAKAQQNLYLLAASFLLLLLILGAWAFRKLRKQQKELTSINQVKNRLFSIIAHDLRGMILPFQRSGKILKYHIDKGNHEKTIEISQALEKNSESLSNMLDNLLNWSLEQMNGYKMNLQNISVSEELKEIVSGYRQQASYKKTKIDLKFKEDLRITFDKGAFHVIFRNLIGNALKYTEEGNIRVEFRNENDMFLCSVVDTGIGISEDQLQNVFTLEEKKSTIGTQGEKGTGLGLNLVYRFVKMHKGTINVSSEKRIGTRFDLSIPITISLTKEEGAISKPLSA